LVFPIEILAHCLTGLIAKRICAETVFGYDAKAREDSAVERAIITKLTKTPKSHENILMIKASLEWGGTYSIFFDLAKKNLGQYFIDTNIIINGVNQKAKYMNGPSDWPMDEPFFMRSYN